jgi:hypothetical protein
MLKFFSGIALLLLALTIEFFLGSLGIYLNLVFAVLIAFAFLFDFLEVLTFVLFAALIINWEPGFSTTLLIFILIPLALYLFRKTTPSEAIVGVAIGVVAGFLLFYGIATTGISFLKSLGFFIDLIVGLAVGELTCILIA